MEPGPPGSKRQRLASWSTSSPHGLSLPSLHSATSPLPPPRASNHHPPPPAPSYQLYPPRPAEPHSSAAPAPIHSSAPYAPPSADRPDRRHHDQEPSCAPMQDHYQHQQHQHPPQPQPTHHHPPVSPAGHGPYQPYTPRDPVSAVKREPGPEDPHPPNSTGHAPDAPPPPPPPPPPAPAPPSHHTLPPPPNYADGQPRHMSYDNGHSLPTTPGAYRGPSTYPPPPPTPISHSPYEPHGSYPSEPFYGVSYSSSLPSKKKNTRASQACDQCRQLKAKCDETKPCKTCRDKGLECKYRDPVPKAPDKAQADILDGIQAMQSTLGTLATHFSRMDERMTKIETAFARGGVPISVKSDPIRDEDMKAGLRSPLMENGAAAEPYYPMDASEDATQGALPPMMAEDAVEAEPGPPVPPGEPAIPINHTTLAGLLLEWPSIRELTKHHLEREGIRYVSEYPIGLEQSRGPLIVYGRGEDSHFSRRSREPADHGNIDMADDSSDIASPSPAADFGQLGGLSPPDMVEYKGGVLAVDGNPDFTEAKVWSYVNSFKTNILNMHPIVQPDVLNEWVQHFLDTLPQQHPRSAKPQIAKPTIAYASSSQAPVEATGLKRKRSVEPDGPEVSKSGRPNRSIHNGLVLTILALGKVCQFRDHIPDMVHAQHDNASAASPVIRNGVPQSPSQSSPPGYPAPSQSSTQPSPKDPSDRVSQSRRPSFHGSTGVRGGYNLKKNYEVIPGLEYFAYASDILGNHAGAYNNMKDVYACIFASLYYGQLNRPLESFAFIHRASHKLQVIMRPSLDKLRNFKKNSQFITDRKYNQLALAFWTCLQLESDLLAELRLPPSGLLSHEEDMPHPNMSLLQGFDQRVLDSYPGQLYLRTHLNSIHRMFYSPDDPNKPGQDKFQNVELVADAVSAMHWVAPSFAFREDDPPGEDILAARLRAKYWGAQVITYRPFIRQILQFSHSITHHPSSPHPPTWNEFREGIIAPVIKPGARLLSEIDEGVVQLARKGIKALIESTRAFHNLGEGRPIITNIFGTAHAQWGNLLVLSAAFRDPILHQHVDEELLRNLFVRTIHFFRMSATATSALRTDLRILEGLQHDLFQLPDRRTNSSFSSHTSTQTPRLATHIPPTQTIQPVPESNIGPPQPPTPQGP